MDEYKDLFLSTDSDYAYIGTFIMFLKMIIDIIKDLFSSINLGGEKKEEGAAE